MKVCSSISSFFTQPWTFINLTEVHALPSFAHKALPLGIDCVLTLRCGSPDLLVSFCSVDISLSAAVL